MEPALFEEFVREFTAELNRQRAALAGDKKALQGELDRTSRQIDKLVEAIIAGADALAVNAKLKLLEEQKTALEAKLAAAPDAEPLLHPALARVYRNAVEELESTHSPPRHTRAGFWANPRLDRRGGPHPHPRQAGDRASRRSSRHTRSHRGRQKQCLLP